MYSDNLTFSESGLQAVISVLSKLKGEISAFKDQYLNYVETNLKPNWTTTNGVQSIEILRNFANEDIQDFINYIQNRIDNFHATAPRLSNINNA